MPREIPINATVHVPADAVTVTTARSSGPGGQNVNKVSSKVDLRVDLSRIVGLTESARARLHVLVRNKLDAEGRLHLQSQLTRDQLRNIDDACQKVRALIEQALIAPKRRKKTKPSRGAVQARLTDKKQRSQTKAARRTSYDD